MYFELILEEIFLVGQFAIEAKKALFVGGERLEMALSFFRTYESN
jgi:hypothetical protein